MSGGPTTESTQRVMRLIGRAQGLVVLAWAAVAATGHASFSQVVAVGMGAMVIGNIAKDLVRRRATRSQPPQVD